MRFNSSNDSSRKRERESDTDVDYELLGSMVDDCLIHLALYNAWEENFLTDMKEKIEARAALSPRQREIIESCHAKVTRRRVR